MKRLLLFAALALALPLSAAAQGFDDLDTAISSLSRGFGQGEPGGVVAGLGDGDQVQLQFPGLIEETGFYGRDQASYLLEKLFSSVKPAGFQQESARKNSAEQQYRINANWAISPEGRRENVTLHITLQARGDRWVLASVRSSRR